MQHKTKYRKRRATSPPCLNQTNIQARASLQRLHSSSLTEPLVLDQDFMDHSSIDQSPSRSSFSLDSRDDPNTEHVIHLSSIEHCMPRAYIRVCLAYRLPDDKDVDQIIAKLNNFIRHTVDAKPYLAGYVRPADKNRSAGNAEIFFTTEDFLRYPGVEVRHLYEDEDEGRVMDFDELDAQGFPPSKLLPDKVAVLPAIKADEKRAPVFRAQANIVQKGLIISFYLHHCISDGTGLGLLVTGAVQEDDFAFKRHLDDESSKTPCVGERLAAFANRKSVERTALSWSFHNETSDRVISFKRLGQPNGVVASNPPGRGCVISIPDSAVLTLRDTLKAHRPGVEFSRHDVLQALIWRHMARARMPVVGHLPNVKNSKLLVPVNIRNKLKEPLLESYFGAAVDFAAAEFELRALVSSDMAVLAAAAETIRKAVERVDEPYIRQAIALARSSDPTVDVRDLLASNMDRVTGADMYITSWERLGLYKAELDLGLGKPQWVRKPWSKDPGSCIVLPRNPDKKQFEVVVQMTEQDMTRLLQDAEFMSYVSRVID